MPARLNLKMSPKATQVAGEGVCLLQPESPWALDLG